ncbi:hypothetical protein N0V83_008274 [Neocucurbitaria cava]|uniref:Uncharacterized protein n=1 Tax=Neocucurbitaria cava TaxID=798079 RepID=A0A9W8Y4A6_9PLEO|nr:hypothetical protein N0V83_008274 [Neocucurbitaria cava]
MSDIAIRSIKSWVKKWGVGKRKRLGTEVEERVKLRVQELYVEYDLQDSEILLHILRKEGFDVSKWTPLRLKDDLGLERKPSRPNKKLPHELLTER